MRQRPWLGDLLLLVAVPGMQPDARGALPVRYRTAIVRESVNPPAFPG
jgi:hypothetical protein